MILSQYELYGLSGTCRVPAGDKPISRTFREHLYAQKLPSSLLPLPAERLPHLCRRIQVTLVIPSKT